MPTAIDNETPVPHEGEVPHGRGGRVLWAFISLVLSRYPSGVSREAALLKLEEDCAVLEDIDEPSMEDVLDGITRSVNNLIDGSNFSDEDKEAFKRDLHCPLEAYAAEVLAE